MRPSLLVHPTSLSDAALARWTAVAPINFLRPERSSKEEFFHSVLEIDWKVSKQRNKGISRSRMSLCWTERCM